jgi:DNA-binding GntR family transcriptional regulator
MSPTKASANGKGRAHRPVAPAARSDGDAREESKGRKGTALVKVYETLRGEILRLELEPGSNLDEGELVARLGVSRTPIREAFLLLANDGLVTLSPNRGACVTSVELTRAREFFEALEVSQRVATRWAALRRGPTDLQAIDRHRLAFEEAVVRRDVGAMIETNIEFHKAIAAACGNIHVLRQYTHLLTLGFRLSQLSLNSRERNSGYYDSAHLQAIVEEHRRMAASITHADAETADRLASEHVTRFRNKILAHLARTRAGEIEL